MTLITALQLKQEGYTRGPIELSTHIVGARFTDSSGKDTSLENVYECWKKYRTVAHLWAALSLRTFEIAEGSDASASLDDGFKLAQKAIALQALAFKYEPYKKEHYLLPKSSLQIVGCSPEALVIPPILDDFYKRIDTFEPRTRA